MTETYRPLQSLRSVVAGLGVLALTLGLLASYASSAQAQYPGPTVDTDGGAQTAQADSPITLDRHEGPTRYETSAEIATDAYDSSTDVVIASGEEFADALSGAALEGMRDAPVLLVPSDLVSGQIPEATTDAIDSLGATNATILGGTDAVSNDVEDYIENNSTVQTSDRVFGTTRFETAEQIAEEVGTAGPIPQGVADQYDLTEDANAAFLATGLNWPDSLAGSPGSFAGQHPILLTTPNDLHSAAERGLSASGAEVVFILGGTAVVSSGVESDLEGQGYDVVRLSGADRWETAQEIADTFADDWGYGVENVGLATGFAFADALASAPFLGNPAPLVLTPTGDTHATTEAFFSNRGCDIQTIDIFGGQAAVEDSVAESYAETACPDEDGEPQVQDYTVELSWVNEVDDSDPDDPQFFQGEPEASGTAELSVDETNGEIDFDVSWDGVTPPFDGAPGLHIHSGAFDENGPIEVTLATGDELQDAAENGSGSVSGTVDEIDDGSNFDSMEALTEAINDTPSDFYVNEHSDDFPAGVIRGQLPDGGGGDVMDSLDLDTSLDPTEGGPGTEVDVTLSGDDLDQIEGVSEHATFEVTGACVEDQEVDLTFADGEATGTVTIADDADVGDCELTFELTVNPSTTFTNTFEVLGTARMSQTNAPELVDVELQREFDDTVRYAFEFDSPVSTQGLSPDNFFLNAWDGTSVAATDVVRDDRGEDDGFSDLENTKVRAVFRKDFTDYDDFTDSDVVDDAAREYFGHLGQWVESTTATTGRGVLGPDGSDASTSNWAAAERADWTDVTTASIRHEAARDLDDERLRSPEASIGIQTVELEGGITQWPTLVEVNEFDTVDNQADFVFDRELSDEEIANIQDADQQFWLIRDGGTTATEQQEGQYEIQSTDVIDVSDSDDTNNNVVTVEFEDPVHSPDHLTSSVVDSVKRAFVEENAFDDGDNPSTLVTANESTTASPMTDVSGGDIDNAASDGLTARPDLDSYEIDYENDEIVYTFDEAVEHVFEEGPDSTFPASMYLVQYRNGQTVYGDQAGIRPDASEPTEVTVDFPDGSITEAIVNVGVTSFRADDNGDGGTITPDTCADTGAARTAGSRHFICNSAASDTGNDTWIEPRLLPVSQSFEPRETLAPNLQSVEVEVVREDPATGEAVEREVRYTFDRPLQIHDLRPESDTAGAAGEVTFTLYDEDGARRTARADQDNVDEGDDNTVVFTTDGPLGGDGSTFSLAGAGDSVVGGVVFGNEDEVDSGDFSGVLSNAPSNNDHAAASRNDTSDYEEARPRRAYSWLWITNYESTEIVE